MNEPCWLTGFIPACYDKVTECILTVYSECGITAFPIDCFALLRHYGFRTFTYSELKEQNLRLYEMCTLYTHDAFRYKDIIAYNEKNNGSRICFSLMHELGHYMLGHSGETPAREHEADYFASNILAPRVMIHVMQIRNADQLHETFGLSYRAANHALADYKNWYFKKTQTIRRLTGTEEQIRHIFQT